LPVIGDLPVSSQVRDMGRPFKSFDPQQAAGAQ
jgi:hypothetical protein